MQGFLVTRWLDLRATARVQGRVCTGSRRWFNGFNGFDHWFNGFNQGKVSNPLKNCTFKFFTARRDRFDFMQRILLDNFKFMPDS